MFKSLETEADEKSLCSTEDDESGSLCSTEDGDDDDDDDEHGEEFDEFIVESADETSGPRTPAEAFFNAQLMDAVLRGKHWCPASGTLADAPLADAPDADAPYTAFLLGDTDEDARLLAEFRAAHAAHLARWSRVPAFAAWHAMFANSLALAWHPPAGSCRLVRVTYADTATVGGVFRQRAVELSPATSTVLVDAIWFLVNVVAATRAVIFRIATALPLQPGMSLYDLAAAVASAPPYHELHARYAAAVATVDAAFIGGK